MRTSPVIVLLVLLVVAGTGSASGPSLDVPVTPIGATLFGPSSDGDVFQAPGTSPATPPVSVPLWDALSTRESSSAGCAPSPGRLVEVERPVVVSPATVEFRSDPTTVSCRRAPSQPGEPDVPPQPGQVAEVSNRDDVRPPPRDRVVVAHSAPGDTGSLPALGFRPTRPLMYDTASGEMHMASPVLTENPLAFAAVAAGFLLAIPAWRLYRRLAHQQVLANATRRTVLDVVVERPGLTAGGLARATGIDRRTALHHLRILEEFDHVEARTVGARRRYYLNGGSYGEIEQRIHAALRNGTARRVTVALLKRPDAGVSGIAALTGLPRSTVHWHIQRLRRLDVVADDDRVRPEAVDALAGV